MEFKADTKVVMLVDTHKVVMLVDTHKADMPVVTLADMPVDILKVDTTAVVW